MIMNSKIASQRNEIEELMNDKEMNRALMLQNHQLEIKRL